MTFFEAAKRIQKEIQTLPMEDIGYQSLESKKTSSVQISSLIQKESQSLDSTTQNRILHEFEGWGPIQPLLEDETVTEIMVNSSNDIWFEKEGQLHSLGDSFISALTFENFLDRVYQESKTQVSIERPFADGVFKNFRIHIVAPPLSSSVLMTLRRQSRNPWNFDRLGLEGWADLDGIQLLQKWVQEKRNFLVVGETGSGKTSVLSACLQNIPQDQRTVILEDTSEIPIPNSASLKLLTRTDCHGVLPDVSLTELVRQSLRMRPDRLVVGEVRGAEAKDLLLALSTGHEGSMGTLHASSPHQALFRLEMLVQLGAPQWSLDTIRRLLKLSLYGIVLVGRDSDKKRKLISIHEISSVENNGLLTDCIYQNTTYQKTN